ncbi:MAG: imelysin family protein [Pseudomonadota bacterium]
MMHRSVLFIAVLLFLPIAPAVADEKDQAKVVAHVLDNVIQPGYQALKAAAERQSSSLAALCEAPGEPALATARGDFGRLVSAWSRVEFARFGPARSDNRFERLFFWPDRRGRGLRQVQGVIAGQDPSAISVKTLRRKSVAVQGLLALEFTLFGTGSDALAGDDVFRCRYAQAIAGNVALTAGELVDGWTGDYGALARNPGPDNPVYRAPKEVLQDFVRSANEQVTIVRDLKIGAALGKTPEAAKPKRAPFWRSDLTLMSIQANLEAMRDLIADRGFSEVLATDDEWVVESFRFEINQAINVIKALESADRSWVDTTGDVEGHQKLAYVQIPMGGAATILSSSLPQALGLTLGFNSLDGD